MSFEFLFTLANAAVMPAWLLLVFAPHRGITRALVHSFIYPALLALFYLFLLVTTWGGDGGMGSLEAVRTGFSRDGVLLLGWVHYLVFDLFIGAWMVRDAKRAGVPHGLIVPSLVLTLMLGPIGLLTYALLRRFFSGSWRL